MTIIAASVGLIDETDTALKLARYAQIIHRSEDQFNGLLNPDTQVDGTCDPIWTLSMRQMIARYLLEAQNEIEQIVGFPLSPRWFIDDQQYYSFPVHAKWKKLLACGFRNTSVISAGAALSYAADPSTVTVATIITDVNEIKVFHPGTKIEIIPSSIILSGGNVTITIPRARLVKAMKVNNPANGWDYTDVPPSATSCFTATVDITRVYNDESIQAGIVFPHLQTANCLCNCSSCCATCGEYAVNACEYISNAKTGAIDVLPASFSAGTWTADCLTCFCQNPTFIRLNYKAGLESLTPQIEDTIVRLAHSKMPSPPCGCGVANELWSRDRNIPTVLTAERLNCKFGLSDGAWWTWRQVDMLMRENQMGFAFA